MEGGASDGMWSTTRMFTCPNYVLNYCHFTNDASTTSSTDKKSLPSATTTSDQITALACPNDDANNNK
ncbi:uncharacterized protein V6R79_008316 [Siganus canaliculatus]